MPRRILIIYVLGMLLTTSITTSLCVDIKAHKLSIDEEDNVFEKSGNLPSYFTWRDIDGVDYVTPIRNQAPYVSCETFAIVGALETMVQYKVGMPFNCDLSEAHLWFSCNPSIEIGSYPDDNMIYLKEHGIPDEACFPYPQDGGMHYPNETCSDWEDRTVKITDWSFLPDDPSVIKNAIMTNGPVPTYFFVYQDFFYHQEGIYRHKWGKAVSPHLMTLIGWDDSNDCWLVKNSWGPRWGEDGWGRVKYGECSIEQYSIYIEDVYGNFPVLYVDDDNTQGPWEGTKEKPYDTIQKAIDGAYEKYAIFVKNGTYYENIEINKEITLIGEDKTNTIIDGGEIDNVINISEYNLTIRGFTIQNSNKSQYKAGVYIKPKSMMANTNVTIENNIIQNNEAGVILFATCSANVKNNIIQKNNYGISVFAGMDNILEGNIIQKNKISGIWSEYGQSIIKSNEIKDNNDYGIHLRGASENNIINSNNTIENNKIGIKLDNSNKNTITGNNFINNTIQSTFNNSFFNRWSKNYWDDWQRILPRIIKGTITRRNIPWINLGWFPSRKIN